MGTHNNVHIFNNCSFKTISRFLKRFYSPNTNCSIEPKEIKKYPIHLLLYLKVERKIDALQCVLTIFHLYLQKPGVAILTTVKSFRPLRMGFELVLQFWHIPDEMCTLDTFISPSSHLTFLLQAWSLTMDI
jgi:hypothetical protein